MGIHPGQQLSWRKRLCDIIIHALLKGIQDIRFIIPCRQHDKDSVNVLTAQFFHDIDSADMRQHPVDDQHIKILFHRQIDSSSTITAFHDIKIRFFQIICNDLADVIFVFNQ